MSMAANSWSSSARAAAARPPRFGSSPAWKSPTAARFSLAAFRSTMFRWAQRNVQMIFQNYALWPHMKVFDERRYSNLTLPLQVRKWSSEKITEYLRPLAWKIGIEESFFKRKPTRTFRRPATARRARPRHGHRAANHVDGRAAEQYRSAQSPEDAPRDPVPFTKRIG